MCSSHVHQRVKQPRESIIRNRENRGGGHCIPEEGRIYLRFLDFYLAGLQVFIQQSFMALQFPCLVCVLCQLGLWQKTTGQSNAICVIPEYTQPGYTQPAIILIFIHFLNCKKTSLLGTVVCAVFKRSYQVFLNSFLKCVLNILYQ